MHLSNGRIVCCNLFARNAHCETLCGVMDHADVLLWISVYFEVRVAAVVICEWGTTSRRRLEHILTTPWKHLWELIDSQLACIACLM